MNSVIAFIVIFGALVFFHELGHFVFAKRAGILCREFAIGMGPKVLAFKRNETQYTLRLLPIGGYVRMAGEDAELMELKPGFRAGLIMGQDEKVEKVVLNNKDRYPDLRVIEVAEADLEKELYIKGYEEGEETLQRFELSEKAVFIEDGVETQIAPWNRQFNSKKLYQRFLTIFAGPAMNFVLAFIVLSIIGMSAGIPVDRAVLGDIVPDDPADQAGLEKGDEVIAISGEEISSWADLTGIVSESPGEELTIDVQRGDESLSFNVTPEERTFEQGEETISQGIIGVYNPRIESPSIFQSIQYGAEQTYFWTVTIFDLLGDLITGQFSIDALAGPVGIYKSTEEVAKAGIYQLMQWGAILSINLGIMNLLPLPALDGGRLLFFGFEALRGKPIDRQKEGMVHFVGFALLMLLMIVVTWNDIQRYFL
ncbi:RIP metalloprotease RseP [Jeotgalibacillus haloalkalitolerans]|uniref:Zinc metalloprotease n=1 Tax=Jeotgalibacillus haloalkalitolerans TaxID=3104292 RepID=A0ABU5KKG3_9BACL|nr:RIP metalloprotease RseP [Jeotgalibacillus sp. HH7-29]MDZ5711755.1 RIP metalloprotease RseP [Jeotgalibacillus sp. HH7-29]